MLRSKPVKGGLWRGARLGFRAPPSVEDSGGYCAWRAPDVPGQEPHAPASTMVASPTGGVGGKPFVASWRAGARRDSPQLPSATLAAFTRDLRLGLAGSVEAFQAGSAGGEAGGAVGEVVQVPEVGGDDAEGGGGEGLV